MPPPSPGSPVRSPESNRLRFVGGLAAAALLLLFWVQAVSASRHWSQTSDELAHVTAGLAYNRLGDFRLQPENGLLPQRVQGLAPLWLGARLPDDVAAWRRSDVWQLGWTFFYGMNNPTDAMLTGARALNALFGVGVGLFIFVVARRWHGTGGGLLALGFYSFCPNFLAHSALATSDLAGTLFLVLAPWLFWRHLERRDVGSGVAAGLASGLALLAKFNGILLAPIYSLLLAIDAARQAHGRRGPRLAGNVALAIGQGAAGVLVIWAAFGFRFAPQAPSGPPFDDFNWPWAEQLAFLGPPGAPLRLAHDWHLVPESWLYGLGNVLAVARGRPAFLAGEYNAHGWPLFFPVLFLAKTPLATLGALVLAAAAAGVSCAREGFRAFRIRLVRAAPLAVPALVLAGAAVFGHLNIGHRHILPVYPALFVLIGGLAASRILRVAALALLLLLGGESLAIRPDYLAFFNRAAGGPAQAYRLAVDSSLDWGQGLPPLRDWLARERRPGEKLYLGLFGSAWPPHYGVRPDVILTDASNLVRLPIVRYSFTPGLYAISATALSGVYSRAERSAATDDPTLQANRRDLARLYAYLRTRKPDAQPGYAILVFRLTADDLARAFPGAGAP